MWQKPDLVLNTLGNLENKVVADIGAGTGYFSFRLAMRAKKVIAIDIDKDVLDTIGQYTARLPEPLDSGLKRDLHCQTIHHCLKMKLMSLSSSILLHIYPHLMII